MKYYNIHNVVGISVDDKYKWDATLICNIPIFESCEEDFLNTATKINIIFSKEIKKFRGYEVVPYIFIDRLNNKIYDKKYGAMIEKCDTGYNLYCYQECNEWMMMLLEYCLLLNKCTFLHSAGVEKDGVAYVFPSWGGVGKTASVARLVRENGYKLLGDDLVIMMQDGSIKPFPKKFVLYAYHKKLFKDSMKKEKAHLVGGWFSKLLSKFLPAIKSCLRLFPGLLAFARRHNPQSKRISPFDIFGPENISEGGALKAFTWLERIDVESTRVVEIDRYVLASKALNITIHELFDGRIQEFMIAICSHVFEYRVLFDDSVAFVNENIASSFCEQLFIPIDYPIENVAGDVVAYTLEKEKA